MHFFKNILKRVFPYSYYKYSLHSIEKKFHNSEKNIKEAIEIRYEKQFKKKINIDEPTTFYEKINNLKYNFDGDVSMYVDKILVKDFLKKEFPYIRVAKLLRVFDTFNDFKKAVLKNELPDPCIIKLNHTSGDIYFYKNKKWKDKYGYNVSKRCVFACVKYRLQLNFYHVEFEKVYDNLSHKIFAEEYLEAVSEGGLDEYKIFCNYGVPKMINVVYGRQKKSDVKEAFTDENLVPFPVSQGQGLLSSDEIYRPAFFDEMMSFAKNVSASFPMIRVDLFANGDSFIFCEFTFYDLAGNGLFSPDEYNKKIGDLFVLKK